MARPRVPSRSRMEGDRMPVFTHECTVGGLPGKEIATWTSRESRYPVGISFSTQPCLRDSQIACKRRQADKIGLGCSCRVHHDQFTLDHSELSGAGCGCCRGYFVVRGLFLQAIRSSAMSRENHRVPC
jgi:hypothetical protein